jgi:hypothetical protein
MSLRTLLALLPLVGALASPAKAQCALSDNLDGGPCCALTQATLPNFSAFSQNLLQVCWQDCGVSQVIPLTAKWLPINIIQPGIVPPCGELRMRLDILGPGNVLFWRGPMRLQYARTWATTGTAGAISQVWRFLVNGDLQAYPPAGGPPCQTFPCLPAFNNKARFTGYIDFVHDCATPVLEYAWMLTHACDSIDHHAGFPRAGVFHPNRSYSFVAPALGFVPGALQPIEGTPFSPFESVRGRTPTTAPVTLACTFEEQAIHSLFPQNQFCFCGAPGSNQFLTADVRIQTACGTNISTPLVGPLLPGYVSMGIGSWTNPAAYPGLQALRWNVAGYDYFDACTGAIQHEIFYGVTTIGGYPATQLSGGLPTVPLPPIFIDQANSVNAGGATTMNQPFNSRHIINLNH